MDSNFSNSEAEAFTSSFRAPTFTLLGKSDQLLICQSWKEPQHILFQVWHGTRTLNSFFSGRGDLEDPVRRVSLKRKPNAEIDFAAREYILRVGLHVAG